MADQAPQADNAADGQQAAGGGWYAISNQITNHHQTGNKHIPGYSNFYDGQ